MPFPLGAFDDMVSATPPADFGEDDLDSASDAGASRFIFFSDLACPLV